MLPPSSHRMPFPLEKLVMTPTLSKGHFNMQGMFAVLCLFLKAESSVDQADLKLTVHLRMILSKCTV